MDLLESWQREIRSSMAQLARTTDATAAKALRLLPFLQDWGAEYITGRVRFTETFY